MTGPQALELFTFLSAKSFESSAGREPTFSVRLEATLPEADRRGEGPAYPFRHVWVVTATLTRSRARSGDDAWVQPYLRAVARIRQADVRFPARRIGVFT